MPATRLMPVGIDFGAKGGMVAVDSSEVFYFKTVPTYAVHVRTFEADLAREKSLVSKSKVALAKKRFKVGRNAGELKPRSTRCFNTAQLLYDITELAAKAAVAGYSGLFFLIEAPLKTSGAGMQRARGHFESVASHFGSGRCQNAWYTAFKVAGCDFAEVSATSWRAGLKLKGDKDKSMEMAGQLYPRAPAELLASHDMAESLLLCHYLKTHGQRYLA